MLTTIRPENGRGCGDRDEGMPYACCGVSKDGLPIEAFVVDPAIPWPGKFQRGIKILPRDPQDPNSVNDLVIFVGAKFYQSAWDFVEETRLFGASRKMSPTLPFEKLTPGQSRMVFVHSKAIPDFEYELNRRGKPLYGCKYLQRWVDNKDAYNDEPPEQHIEGTLCTHALKDLAFLVHGDIEPSENDPEFYRVNMPSFNYTAKYPLDPPTYKPAEWQVGIFLALPLTHFEFCRKPHQAAQGKAEQAGFQTMTLEY